MSVNVYSCKTCAAPIAYDIKQEKWKCEYCSSEFAKDEIVEKTSNEGEMEVVESLDVKIPELDEYRCNACGARILTEGNAAATFCIYCRNPSVIKSRFSGEFHPRYLIPFKVTLKEAKETYFTWIKKRFFAPDELKTAREVDNIRGLYAPYWLFDCRASGFVEGEGRNSKSWRSGDYRITETQHYYIKRVGSSAYDKIPVDGSKSLADDLMEGIEPFNYSAIKDFSLEYMSGYLAEKYDVNEQQAARAMEPRAQKFLRATLEASGQRYQSMSISSSSININSVKAAYSMLPVYVLTNVYKGKKHTFMINGQTGKTYGETPFDTKKCVVFSVALFFTTWFVTVTGAVILGIY
ncbi:MAG TPA: DNA helicase PriA [Candidatus Riflebacteria bacterium]|jgi:DNA-directed RNA polymerase subunit RPC12/RpoP|nr:DNA helicase PriA [Candidatus Riflebacteria bacterium]